MCVLITHVLQQRFLSPWYRDTETSENCVFLLFQLKHWSEQTRVQSPSRENRSLKGKDIFGGNLFFPLCVDFIYMNFDL